MLLNYGVPDGWEGCGRWGANKLDGCGRVDRDVNDGYSDIERYLLDRFIFVLNWITSVLSSTINLLTFSRRQLGLKRL